MNKETARQIVYILGACVGAGVVALGAWRSDPALIAAGVALLGTDVLAARNITPSS